MSADTHPDVAALLTIIQHREIVADKLSDIAHMLRQRGRAHDRTKLDAELYPGFVAINAGEPRSEMSTSAVLGHYLLSPHHPECHVSPTDMGWLDVIEMVVDWYAAAEAYRHNPDAYGFREGVDRHLVRWEFSPAQEWLIREVAEWLEPTK